METKCFSRETEALAWPIDVRFRVAPPAFNFQMIGLYVGICNDNDYFNYTYSINSMANGRYMKQQRGNIRLALLKFLNIGKFSRDLATHLVEKCIGCWTHSWLMSGRGSNLTCFEQKRHDRKNQMPLQSLQLNSTLCSSLEKYHKTDSNWSLDFMFQ